MDNKRGVGGHWIVHSAVGQVTKGRRWRLIDFEIWCRQLLCVKWFMWFKRNIRSHLLENWISIFANEQIKFPFFLRYSYPTKNVLNWTSIWWCKNADGYQIHMAFAVTAFGYRVLELYCGMYSSNAHYQLRTEAPPKIQWLIWN